MNASPANWIRLTGDTHLGIRHRGTPKHRMETGMRRKYLVVVLVLGVVLAACAAGANPEVGIESPDGDVAGFWLGLWHGIIAPITFAISLFRDTVNVYDVHNNGNWYDFGFVIGAGILFGGGGSGACRSRKRK